MSWQDLVETVDYMLLALGPREPGAGRPASFEIYADNAGQHRWRLSTTNGRIVGTSPDGYSSRTSARAAAERMRENAASYSYVVDADDAGNYRWHASAANGQVVAVSGESFSTRDGAARAARAARELAASAAGPEDGHGPHFGG